MANETVRATCIEVKGKAVQSAKLPTLKEVQRAAEVHRLIEAACEALEEAHGLCNDDGDHVSRDRILAAQEVLLLIQGHIDGGPRACAETVTRLLDGSYWKTLQ